MATAFVIVCCNNRSTIQSTYMAHQRSFKCKPSNFYGSQTSSSGLSVNGIIFWSNLDIFEDIITGLPVSDHDHGRLVSRNVILFVVLSLHEIRNSLTPTPTLLTFQA
jgi:hypothetical protein